MGPYVALRMSDEKDKRYNFKNIINIFNENHKMSYIKYKSHKKFVKLYNESVHDLLDYYKCEKCGMEVRICKSVFFNDEAWTLDNLSCNEFLIKNIIK